MAAPLPQWKLEQLRYGAMQSLAAARMLRSIQHRMKAPYFRRIQREAWTIRALAGAA